MPLFTSLRPRLEIPEHLTIWDWAFESSETSPLQKHGGKPRGAYIDAATNERLDWVETKSKSIALNAALTEQYGLRKGDTVTIFTTNSIWYPVCSFATIRTGAWVNGASAALTVGEMAYALREAHAKLVIAIPSAIDRVVEAAKQVGISENNVLLMFGQRDGFTSIQELIEHGSHLPIPAAYQLPSGSSNKALCGFLNFSSGTTGLPKAVMLSHHNVIATCMQAAQGNQYQDFHQLAILPISHITGTWRYVYLPILLDSHAVMVSTFTMPAMLQAIVDYRIEQVILVPPLILRLARDPIVDKYDLSHVKIFTSGAAPLSMEVLKSFEQRFPWVSFRQGYGATEMPFVAALPPGQCDWKFARTTGGLVANTEAKIVDTNGQELESGQTGELLIRGPQVAMGYFKNEYATDHSFDSEGFFHTGDVCHIDENGMLHVTDRIKELIKVKAFQVPPAELEDLLLGHELVSDCAVIGIPDVYAGELPKAYVVPISHVSPGEEVGHALFDYVRQHKISYKWLVEIEFVDQIPKSPAGKILRQKLRERERARLQVNGDTGTAGLRVQDAELLQKASHVQRFSPPKAYGVNL